MSSIYSQLFKEAVVKTEQFLKAPVPTTEHCGKTALPKSV
jgi:hypothetical protein